MIHSWPVAGRNPSAAQVRRTCSRADSKIELSFEQCAVEVDGERQYGDESWISAHPAQHAGGKEPSDSAEAGASCTRSTMTTYVPRDSTWSSRPSWSVTKPNWSRQPNRGMNFA